MKTFLFLLSICLLTSCSSSKTSKPSGQVVILTNQNFQKRVVESKDLSVVYFWATWCGPCRMVKPVMEDLAKKETQKVSYGKVDVDNNVEIATNYGIRSIPTILIIKEGKVVDKHVGVVTTQALEKKIEAHL